jgi:hypothetical protein
MTDQEKKVTLVSNEDVNSAPVDSKPTTEGQIEGLLQTLVVMFMLCCLTAAITPYLISRIGDISRFVEKYIVVVIVLLALLGVTIFVSWKLLMNQILMITVHVKRGSHLRAIAAAILAKDVSAIENSLEVIVYWVSRALLANRVIRLFTYAASSLLVALGGVFATSLLSTQNELLKNQVQLMTEQNRVVEQQTIMARKQLKSIYSNEISNLLELIQSDEDNALNGLDEANVKEVFNEQGSAEFFFTLNYEGPAVYNDIWREQFIKYYKIKESPPEDLLKILKSTPSLCVYSRKTRARLYALFQLIEPSGVVNIHDTDVQVSSEKTVVLKRLFVQSNLDPMGLTGLNCDHLHICNQNFYRGLVAAKIRNCVFENVNFQRCSFDLSLFDSTHFTKCKFYDCSFIMSELPEPENFSECEIDANCLIYASVATPDWISRFSKNNVLVLSGGRNGSEFNVTLRKIKNLQDVCYPSFGIWDFACIYRRHEYEVTVSDALGEVDSPEEIWEAMGVFPPSAR